MSTSVPLQAASRPGDHFSGHADLYAKYRPSYPPALFEWLAAQCRAHQLAWDCGTGNGQAAIALAGHFSRVIGTDLSAEQIARAAPAANVSYRAAPADASGLPVASVDLVTVAQALHWFCGTPFYTEVRRVLKPGGVIAAWTYRLLDAEPAINALVADFHGRIVGPFWPAERHWVDAGYAGMPFPFEEIVAPAFEIELHWTLDDLLAYLRTWSATQRFIKERGDDPTLPLGGALKELWGDPDATKRIVWPLAIRCGRFAG